MKENTKNNLTEEVADAIIVDMRNTPFERRKKMADAGLTVSEIARVEGVSKQAIHEYFNKYNMEYNRQKKPTQKKIDVRV